MKNTRIFKLFTKKFPLMYQFAKDNSNGESIWSDHDSNSILIKVKRNLTLLFTYNNKVDWILRTYEYRRAD